MSSLQLLTVNELKELCRQNKVSGYSGLRKSEIIDLLYSRGIADSTSLKPMSNERKSPAIHSPVERKHEYTPKRQVYTASSKPAPFVIPANTKAMVVATSSKPKPVAIAALPKPKPAEHKSESTATGFSKLSLSDKGINKPPGGATPVKYTKETYLKEVEEQIAKMSDDSTLDGFLRAWSLRYYMRNMAREDRYTVDDMIDYNWRENLTFDDQLIIEMHGFLQDFYQDLNIDNVVNIPDILKRYSPEWNHVLVQRLYRKYINKDYIVIVDSNKFDATINVTFI